MLRNVDDVRRVYLGSSGILAPSGERHAVCLLAPATPHPGALQIGISSCADGVRPSLLIDCSTIDSPSAREVATAVQSVRLHKSSRPFPECSVARPSIIDAPVSGGIQAAAAGSLTFMVSEQTPMSWPSLTSRRQASSLSLQSAPPGSPSLARPPGHTSRSQPVDTAVRWGQGRFAGS